MCAFKMLPLETCANVCACDALTAHVCVQVVFWLLPDALAAHVCVQIVFGLLPDALAAHVCVQIGAWPPPAGPTYES